MIVEPPVLVKGDNEHRIRPVLGIAERLIHAFQQILPFPDVIQGMHGIAIQVVVPRIVTRLDKTVVTQGPVLDIIKEVIHSRVRWTRPHPAALLPQAQSWVRTAVAVQLGPTKTRKAQETEPTRTERLCGSSFLLIGTHHGSKSC